VLTLIKQVAKHALNSYLTEINKDKLHKVSHSARRMLYSVKKPDHFELKIELLADNNCHRIGTENLTLRDSAGNKNLNP
jgi:hypothetical protein